MNEPKPLEKPRGNRMTNAELADEIEHRVQREVEGELAVRIRVLTELPQIIAALRQSSDKVLVTRAHLNDALSYIKHCGANAVMRGQPHPQQQIVDWLAAALAEAEGHHE